MHERRNFTLILGVILSLCWTAFAWLIAPDYWPSIPPGVSWHKVASLVLVVAFSGGAFYVLRFQDPLDDELSRVTGGAYYEKDGLCVMPVIRINEKTHGAEVSLYFQNRFSNPCEAVIHLRPPPNTIATHRHARDIHFAFNAPGGGFGVVHQPIAVHPKAQGEVVEIELAAAVRWPRTHGDELRKHKGMKCGSFTVDWALAYRQSEHELNGELEVKDPARLHLALPHGVSAKLAHNESTQETISAA